MDPFTMVVAIVAISVGAGLINTWLKHRSNSRPDEATLAELATTKPDLTRLKDRVRVLEEIVTDKERQLSDEIRRLG
ncbi:hypothetical protein [Hyphomonas sp.]|uniref:hypothetical protein n=1 Tax=Hyphomonas sp. TaxID=87 RepID=UPI00391D6A66